MDPANAQGRHSASRSPASSRSDQDNGDTWSDSVDALPDLGSQSKSEVRKEGESSDTSILSSETAVVAVSKGITQHLEKSVQPLTKKLISRVQEEECEIMADFQILPAKNFHLKRLLSGACSRTPRTLRSEQKKVVVSEALDQSASSELARTYEQSTQPSYTLTNHTATALDRSVQAPQGETSESSRNHGQNGRAKEHRDEIVPSAGSNIIEETLTETCENVAPNPPRELQIYPDLNRKNGTTDVDGDTTDVDSDSSRLQSPKHVPRGPSNPKAVSASVPLLDSSCRITKRKSAPSNKLAGRTQSEASVSSHASSSNGLSEKDLLHMLMYRSQHREQNNVKAQQRQQELEARNRELQDHQVDLRQELENAIATKNTSIQYAETLRKDFESFQGRYRKLKSWALEMNNEYAAIRQEGHDIKTVLAQLSHQHVAAREPVRAALHSNLTALTTIDNLKKDLHDVHETAEKLNAELKEASNVIAEKRGELRVLKLTESEHKSHVKELLSQQERFNRQTTASQSDLTTALDNISIKVDSITTHSTTLSKLDEILRAIHEISARDVVSGAELQQIDRSIAELRKQMGTVQGDANNALQAMTDSGAHTSIINEISTIAGAVSRLKPEMAEVQELRAANARLQTKVDGNTAVHKSFEEFKQSAKQHMAELQEKYKKLVKSVAILERHGDQNSRQTVRDAQTRISEALAKFDIATGELNDAKAKIQSYEVEVALLKKSLSESEKQHSSDQRHAKSEHQAAMQSLREINDNLQQSIKKEMENEVKQKDQEVTALTQMLRDSHEKNVRTIEQLNVKKATEEKINKTLVEAQHELAQTNTRLQDQNELHEKLVEECQKLRQLANEIPALRTENAEREKTIAELRQDNSGFQNLRTESGSLRNKLKIAEETIAELNKSIQAALQDCVDKGKLQCQLNEQIMHVNALQKRLLLAENEAASIQELKRALDEKDVQIKHVRKLLEDEQKVHRALEEADYRARTLEDNIKDLNERLSAAEEQANQVSTLQESNQEQEEAIGILEARLLVKNRLEMDLSVVRQQLDEKSVKIQAQKTEIQQLNVRLTEQAQPQKLTQDNDVNTTLIHDTKSSLTAHNGEHGQNTSENAAQSTQNDSSAHDGLTQVIDPTLLMAIASPRSQITLVPDSQLPMVGDPSSKIYPDARDIERSDCTSSSLSEVNEEYLDTDIELDEGAIEVGQGCGSPYTHNNSGDDIFDIPTGSPDRATRSKYVKRTTRTSTSMSPQDDMLLQASEPGHLHSSPHSSPKRRDGTKDTPTSLHGPGHLSKPAKQSAQPQPRNSIVDERMQTKGRGSTSTSSILPDLRAASREPHRPNSAVKRRVEDIDVNACFNEKRLKLSSRRHRTKQSTTTEEVSSLTAHSSPSRLMPVARNGNTITSSDVKKNRRARSSRKQSKPDKYASQFGESHK